MSLTLILVRCSEIKQNQDSLNTNLILRSLKNLSKTESSIVYVRFKKKLKHSSRFVLSYNKKISSLKP